jgi:hypothetical protein
MAPVTQPLKDEHAELRQHLEAIGAAADAVDDVAPRAGSEAGASPRLLDRAPDPACDRRREGLYPAANQAMGSPRQPTP